MKRNRIRYSLALSTMLLMPLAITSLTEETTAHAAQNQIDFKDIKTHWAKSQIEQAVSKGYISGYEDGTFKPEQSVSNAEFIKMLVVALNPNESIPVISGNSWYKPYLEVAASNGLVKTSEFDGKYNSKMVRSDLAKLGAKAIGETTTEDKKWLYIATQNGLINGVDTKGTLKETGNMTRAQAVTVIERVLKVNQGETLPVDKYAVANAEIVWHNTNIFTMLPQWFTQKTISNYVVNDSKLISASPDGNVVSKAKKLVVIDTDDSNDPNRSLLQNRELVFYDGIKDVIHYYEPTKPNGYVIVSVNELDIKDISKLPISTINGAEFSVSFNKRTSKREYFYSLVPKRNIANIYANSVFVKKEQKIQHYDYLTGYYISKDYPISKGEFISIYFKGMIEWGDINGSLLYSEQYIGQ